MSGVDPQEQIRIWLTEAGYSFAQIERIMKRVEDYDAHAFRDSLFDSIGSGEIAVQEIIRQALDEAEES